MTDFPNTSTSIQRRIIGARLTWRWPVIMLVARLVLFAVWQVVVVVIYAVQATPNPWDASIPWWPVTAILTNLTCLGLLTLACRREGMRLSDLYHVEPHPKGREVLICLGLLVIGLPLAMVPNFVLGSWLFGDVSVPFNMMFRALPVWAFIPSLVLFPLTIALTEMPVYYAYTMPRIAKLSGSAWFAVLLVGFFHGLQHIALPLIFDGRFMLWRLGMYLPFALFIAVILYRRPRQLPYLMAVHGLMDLQAILMILPMMVA